MSSYCLTSISLYQQEVMRLQLEEGASLYVQFALYLTSTRKQNAVFGGVQNYGTRAEH